MVRFYGTDISLLVKIITGIAFLFYTKSDVNGNLASTCGILYLSLKSLFTWTKFERFLLANSVQDAGFWELNFGRQIHGLDMGHSERKTSCGNVVRFLQLHQMASATSRLLWFTSLRDYWPMLLIQGCSIISPECQWQKSPAALCSWWNGSWTTHNFHLYQIP
jgi:hypothetical protein